MPLLEVPSALMCPSCRMHVCNATRIYPLSSLIKPLYNPKGPLRKQYYSDRFEHGFVIVMLVEAMQATFKIAPILSAAHARDLPTASSLSRIC